MTAGADHCMYCGLVIPEGSQLCRACTENTNVAAIHKIRQALENAKQEVQIAMTWLELIDKEGPK